MESPVKDTKTDVVAGGDNVVVTTFPTPESESQVITDKFYFHSLNGGLWE